MLQAAYVLPHPPLAVPEVGRGREVGIKDTINSYLQAANEIKALSPDTLVFISPHATAYYDYIHISPSASAYGDFSSFGAKEVAFNVQYDTEFVKVLSAAAKACGISAGAEHEQEKTLDHGVMVPLYFIDKVYKNCSLVRTGLSGLPPLEHYKFGTLIGETAEKLSRKTVIIASGDLSHKLKKSHYGYAPEGEEFDNLVMDILRRADFLSLLNFDPALCAAAGECGYRSFLIMAGALDKKRANPRFLSYEGPFGVGYGACAFDITGIDDARNFGEQFFSIQTEKIMKERKAADPYAALARLAAEHIVKTGKSFAPSKELLGGELGKTRRAVFVSCKKDGELRGCIGSILPTCGNLVLEIIRFAEAAVMHDPRFPPVGQEELEMLSYSVDVLEAPEPATFEELDPKVYGVIVSAGSKRGVLLPDLEGVNTAREQVEIAIKKGGITSAEKYSLEKFKVTRHK
ncbi:MAG: AmmeMemoRadiSam system protein A [Deferribacteraceae bacterium]|jgi:AmmeMemoRadiSam system protein A|nr:AmmeMemoRadiSam system protein A [Deferribacteraceae bacterium]